ncbi:1-acyl-sn-glycerol-3-phosphate acyltransferase [Oscillospiraceae bacterium HV4-5-C5C]|nr:1-acyl-sn-glycerol-3-phosphate acyltransferase [Oscillospiraceae bacterium HV4-5-C5C]
MSQIRFIPDSVLHRIAGVLLRAAFNYDCVKDCQEALPEGPAVVVCNHVHALDCAGIWLALFPRKIYFVSQLANWDNPVIGGILNLADVIPLEHTVSGLTDFIQQGAARLKENGVICIYPEGNLLPYNQTLQPFHNGAFRLAVEQKVPVVVCAYKAVIHSPWLLPPAHPDLTLHIAGVLHPDPHVGARQEAYRLQQESRQLMEKVLRPHPLAEPMGLYLS